MRVRYVLTAAAIIVIAAAVGCIVTGDDPVTFTKHLFAMEYTPMLETGASIAMVAAFGFLTSFHCIGMCGGIVLSQSATRPVKNGWLYNAGRVVSYTLVGCAAGAIGGVVSLNGHLRALVPLVCAVVMLVMGLNMLGLFRYFNITEPKPLKRLRGKGAAVVGFLTGFMPCGMLNVAQVHALGSGGAISGAAVMFTFAVATAPVLFTFGALSGALTAERRGIILKVAAVIVLVMGAMMLMKALKLMEVVT